MNCLDKVLVTDEDLEQAKSGAWLEEGFLQFYESFADAMKFNRRIRAVTLRELEKMTGISNPMLSQYETQHSEPSFRNASIVAQALGFSLDSIWVEK